jgi:hypothetical protein
MLRIVFLLAFFRQKLPVQLVSTSTKSRWKFYTQFARRSFHTAWVRTGSDSPKSNVRLTPESGLNLDIRREISSRGARILNFF